jgi:hypothetical protein
MFSITMPTGGDGEGAEEDEDERERRCSAEARRAGRSIFGRRASQAVAAGGEALGAAEGSALCWSAP